VEVLAKNSSGKQLLMQDRTAAAPAPVLPFITLVDVLGLLKAYPLYGLMRLCPDFSVWVAKAALGPAYQLIHRGKRRLLAKTIIQSLDVPVSEGRALARLWIRHYARHRWESLSTLLSGPPSIGDQRSVLGLQHLDRALEENGGVLLVSVHWFASMPAKRLLRRMNYPILTVRAWRRKGLGRVGNRWLLPRLLQLRARIRTGSESVDLDDPGCALALARRLREGGIVHLASDARESNTAVTVRFLNGRVPLSSGVLELARLCHCPVLPLVAVYAGNGIRIELGAPLGFRYEGTAEECARTNFPILIAELERQVRSAPDQWAFWVEG